MSLDSLTKEENNKREKSFKKKDSGRRQKALAKKKSCNERRGLSCNARRGLSCNARSGGRIGGSLGLCAVACLSRDYGLAVGLLSLGRCYRCLPPLFWIPATLKWSNSLPYD